MSTPDAVEYIVYPAPTDDGVVRVLFDAQVESAVAEPVTVPFVVKVTRTDLHNKVHRDIVSLGKLTVLPAPLGA